MTAAVVKPSIRLLSEEGLQKIHEQSLAGTTSRGTRFARWTLRRLARRSWGFGMG